MNRLTDKQVNWICTAGVLHTFAAEALSPFQRETLAAVSDRFLTQGPDATTTADEWRIVEEAVDVMTERYLVLHTVEVTMKDGKRYDARAVRRGGRC